VHEWITYDSGAEFIRSERRSKKLGGKAEGIEKRTLGAGVARLAP
jgi:hypothetical protein